MAAGAAIGLLPYAPSIASRLLHGFGKTASALGFGAAYAGGTAMGFNETNTIFGYRNNSHKYYGRPSNFKLPYYRYRSRYGRRYRKRYGLRRRRFFSRYRTRRFY